MGRLTACLNKWMYQAFFFSLSSLRSQKKKKLINNAWSQVNRSANHRTWSYPGKPLITKRFENWSRTPKSAMQRYNISIYPAVINCLHQIDDSCKYHADDIRSVNNFKIPRCRLATGQLLFAYGGVKIWNGLRKHLRTLTSLEIKTVYV